MKIKPGQKIIALQNVDTRLKQGNVYEILKIGSHPISVDCSIDISTEDGSPAAVYQSKFNEYFKILTSKKDLNKYYNDRN